MGDGIGMTSVGSQIGHATHSAGNPEGIPGMESQDRMRESGRYVVMGYM